MVALDEILYICIFSVILAAIFTVMHTNKLHFKLFRKLKITNKFGEMDVWGYLMNSPDSEWLTIRDFENNLVYDGHLIAFSDNGKDAEILLGNVDVYNNNEGKILYNVYSQYLSLNRSKISIEIRKGETDND